MERHLDAVPDAAAARTGASPDHDRLLRPGHRAQRPYLRGDVQILLPGPHIDKRFVQLAGESSFGRLLDCGVKIWQFQPSMLHAKVMTVDGVLANIGSANLNARSTELDEEVNLVAFDAEVVRVLDAQFDEDLTRSEAIVAGRWEERSVPRRLVERAAGWFRHEM